MFIKGIKTLLHCVNGLDSVLCNDGGRIGWLASPNDSCKLSSSTTRATAVIVNRLCVTNVSQQIAGRSHSSVLLHFAGRLGCLLCFECQKEEYYEKKECNMERFYRGIAQSDLLRLSFSFMCFPHDLLLLTVSSFDS